MKKALITVLLTMLFVNMTCVASASVNLGNGVSFSIYAQCSNEKDYDDATTYGYKTKGMAAVYVDHRVSGSSYMYTNHFRVRKFDGSRLVTSGSNWCSIGIPSKIKGDKITEGYKYTVAGRGNTKHYLDGGIEEITLYGTFYVNACEN